MKNKAIVTSIFLGCISLLHAQTNKGNFILGLYSYDPTPIYEAINIPVPTNAFGISFYRNSHYLKSGGSNIFTQNAPTSKYFSFSFNGSIQYCIVNNFSAGINLYFMTSNYRSGSNKKKTFHILGGPQIRFYVNIKSKLKYWISADYALGASKQETDKEDYNTKYLNRIGGQTGVAWFIMQHFSLDAGIGYAFNRSQIDLSDENNLVISKNYERQGLFTLGFTCYF